MVTGLTGRWPELAMGQLLTELTWLGLGWLNCLQAESHELSWKTLPLLCQSQASILWIAIFASYWQFLDVLLGRGLAREASTCFVWQSWYLEGSTCQSHTVHWILVCTACAGHLFSFRSLCRHWRNSTNSLSCAEASSISLVVIAWGVAVTATNPTN